MLIDDFCSSIRSWHASKKVQIEHLEKMGNGWETWAQAEIEFYCLNNSQFVVHREKPAYGESKLDTRRVDFVVTEKKPSTWSSSGIGKIEQIFVELKCGGYSTPKSIQADITKFKDFYYDASFSRFVISITGSDVIYYAA